MRKVVVAIAIASTILALSPTVQANSAKECRFFAQTSDELNVADSQFIMYGKLNEAESLFDKYVNEHFVGTDIYEKAVDDINKLVIEALDLEDQLIGVNYNGNLTQCLQSNDMELKQKSIAFIKKLRRHGVLR